MRHPTDTTAPKAAIEEPQHPRPLFGTRARRRYALTMLMLLIAVFWTVPSLWALSTSLKPTPDIYKLPPIWFPLPATLEHYRALFSNDQTTNLARALVNSIVYSVVAMVLVLIISALAAFPLARMRFPGRTIILGAIIGSLMVPGVISIVPLYLLMFRLGWVGTYQALIVPQLASAFGVFLLRQFFLSVPHELEDAARIDGASSWQVFSTILLPLSRPAIVTLAILTFQGTWNDFTWPLIVLNNQSMFTLPVALSLLQSAYAGTSYGPIMGGAVVSAIPLLVVFILANRYIVDGVRLGSLRG